MSQCNSLDLLAIGIHHHYNIVFKALDAYRIASLPVIARPAFLGRRGARLSIGHERWSAQLIR